MQTLRKKTSPCKYRNDPGRFFGDGVTFKAKLIGILEVGEARGDRMCQEALQDLKMAIRAAGEHKQRITIHVTIDGLRLRDEKTGDSLYHHPVHKISFIAQDMTDSRAFGYIFGSPDSGHRFFGIKTDKAASQVVLAMRDLFQVVFELKKKEIEMARQQIQSKTIHEHQPLSLTVKSNNISNDTSSINSTIKSVNELTKSNVKEMSPESVADLVDLEQELSSIQRGITQMERITPSEPTPSTKIPSEEDPFGDSFTNFPTYNLLPPPESSRSRHSKPSAKISDPVNDQLTVTFKNVPTLSTSTVTNISSQPSDNWLSHNEMISQFESSTTTTVTTKNLDTDSATSSAIATTASTSSTGPTSAISNQQFEDIAAQKTGEDKTSQNANNIISSSKASSNNDQNQYIDAFTDLDPLGTGKSKPYVDKKYFFHELKNPPKKVLKELSGQEGSFSVTFTGTEINDSISIGIASEAITEKSSVEQKYKSSSSLAGRTTTSTSIINENKINNFSPPACSQTNYLSSQLKTSYIDKPLNIDLERTKLEEPIMMPRDTDPFSPTRKKSDPFQDGDIFSKLDPFEFEFTNKISGSTTTVTKPLSTITVDDSSTKTKKETSMFNGPLQVNLPPESSSWNTSPGQRKIERQTSESPTSISRNRPSVFKQNTVDVISSISSKKMPHLFGQKFSKRDSNSINMRRLQESDSLSENEAAPEPPPRPDTSSHIEPPPLPPKKQFSDIIIRPRITSSSAVPPPARYEYISSKMKPNNNQSLSSLDSNAPPIPLPSRKVGRIDSSFPGPGRPARKPGSAVAVEEEDYLTPITASRNDVPPLLPPPQTKGRGRRSDYSELKSENENMSSVKVIDQQQNESILPDITLSQLLTLGIDELATKLNVPTSKLSTMTLVELTTYLSEFIENRKKNQEQQQQQQQKSFIEETTAPVFKVNFDQNSEATFIAKFDDNFVEEPPAAIPFVANFSNIDIKPEQQVAAPPPVIVPSADRYAVFREIIDQEMQYKEATQRKDSSDIEEDDNDSDQNKAESATVDSENETTELNADSEITIAPMQVPKIDTKITEAISHAKDRYAALRDIILVEDLFEKPSKPIESFSNTVINITTDWQEESHLSNIKSENTFEESSTKYFEEEASDSPIGISEDNEEKSDMNQKEDSIATTTIHSTKEIKRNGGMHTLAVSNNKDDVEIDELMNRAISNLSLDSREHVSPNFSKSSAVADNNSSAVSPTAFNKQQRISPNNQTTRKISGKIQFNDVSTSPVHQLQKSPVPAQKSPLSKSPLIKSPVPQSTAVTNLIDSGKRANSGSLSDMVCGSSPEANSTIPEPSNKVKSTTAKTSTPPINTDESWAVFDKSNVIDSKSEQPISRPYKPTTVGMKDTAGESPCSSDGKDDWKGDQEYGKKWPRGQTSSSSRDLSPWDDEAPDYKKRIPPGADRHGYYMRHARRMNSCDDDYDYEEEMIKRRDRRMKPPMSRSRENFDSDSQNWYQSGGSGRHNWSPPDDDERLRPLDRNSYERSTYGPPYDKRHPAYDRREYSKSYDKRKYYREYSRPPPQVDYEFESPYGESPDIKDSRKMLYYGDGMGFEKSKSRRDYENIYEEEFVRDGNRSHKSSRGEYFYDRDRKSFDRDSVESYESTGRRHRSFGSGDVYGSLDSREDFRERYLAGNEKSKSLRKGMKIRTGGGGGGGNEEYEQDSENEVPIRRPPGDTRSLQRPPQGTRMRKSSGSSPWDGEEPPPPPTQKGWKRPSSASESERRLAENRRVLCHTLSGSDGEKDRRFRKKPRSRSVKEIDSGGRQTNIRYRDRDGNYEYIDYEEEDYEQPVDEDKFERLNRRRFEMHQRMVEIERKKRGDKYSYERDKYPSSKNIMFASENDPYTQKFDAFEAPSKSAKSLRREFDFEDLDDTPRSNTSSNNKFNFEERGFESDFNSPPPPPPPSTTIASTIGGSVTSKSFRFSNDFSDKQEKFQASFNSGSDHQPQEPMINNQTPTQKLRFDDKVTISKFENEQPTATATATSAFEDDFSQAEFVFDDDQWNSAATPTTTTTTTATNVIESSSTAKPVMKNHLRLTKRQENIKKSESVNIFARKTEDPFEDDDFFKTNTLSSPTQQQQQQLDNKRGVMNKRNGNNEISSSSQLQWDNNFAKFDENM